ncbi:hypothetical protein DRJ16_02085 [Candidatus Woesearchaeota archaeon]|nr:MAG: hypothetical protein DRJ16_02085 [Candidatus Woesearchaeota archaeon]
MVFELLINPKKAEGKPWELFFLGFAYSILGLIIGYIIFRSYVSLVMVVLAVIASVPFMHSLISREEQKDLAIGDEKKVLKAHMKSVEMFAFLFLGFLVGYVVSYVLLPGEVAAKIFSTQINTIMAVRSAATGNFFSSMNMLSAIFFNNIKILLFCILFSFFYGAGAIFILTWNASVMAAAIGGFISNELRHANVFQVTVNGFMKYLSHGLPEIIAYFIGALAGGIIGIAMIKHEFRSKEFNKIMKDALNLIFIAVTLLLVASLIEVFITPLLFG